jgi:type II secretion system protein D
MDEASQLKVYKLLHASSVDAERIVRDFFVEAPGSGEDNRAGLGTRVRVIADYRTNGLVVQASPRDQIEVARLIAEIDVENTPAQNEIRVFQLEYALATDLQPILQAAISGQAIQGGQGNQGGGGGGGGGGGSAAGGQVTSPSSNLTIVSKDKGRTDSGILAGVVVTSNPSINSLLVRGPAKSMDLIAALIAELDRPPSAETQLKVFEIKNGDATQLTLLVQQLFGIASTAGQAGGGFGNQGGGGLGNQAGGLGGLGGTQSGIVPLRVSTDTRTNSIIASGAAVDLEVLEVLLLRLDEAGIETRKTEVIWLRNSNATNVAQAISNLLANQRALYQQSLLLGQTVSVFEQIDREVIVVAEAATNSLIVSATPRYFDRVRQVIEALDRRPPMIMVQIMLAEVTLDDNFEMGTELGLQDALLFDRNSATGGTLTSPGFNTSGDPGSTILNLPANVNPPLRGRTDRVAGQGLSGFGLERVNSALGYGGLVLAASSESVSILFRALQDASRLQILSRPQVMTLDTVAAFVQVGQLVPRIQGVQGGTNVAAPVITTTDVPIGLIMRVQPRTNQDGLILLDVQVERSKLGPEDEGIPVGFGANGEVIRSPIIDTTRAETRISAYDGQTVVFAGLISKERSSRSRRIPFLADIPFAGWLFKYETETERRSELLVVMTPRIVRDPSDVEMINQLESSRMSWCLADVLNMHGVSGLSEGNGLWGPACSPIIYPDESPTADWSGSSNVVSSNDMAGLQGGILVEPGSVMVPSTSSPMESIPGAPVPSAPVPAAPLAMPPGSSTTEPPAPIPLGASRDYKSSSPNSLMVDTASYIAYRQAAVAAAAAAVPAPTQSNQLPNANFAQ